MPWMFGDHWSSWAGGGFFGWLFGGFQMVFVWLVPLAVLAFVVWLIVQATQKQDRQQPTTAPLPGVATAAQQAPGQSPTETYEQTPATPAAMPAEQTAAASPEPPDTTPVEPLPTGPAGQPAAPAVEYSVPMEPLPTTTTARAILDERYARGEIDRDEYLQRRADLSS